MLDIKFIRENVDLVKDALTKKQIELDLDHLLTLDGERRTLIQEEEGLRAQQNAANQGIAQAKGEEKAKMVAEMKTISDKAAELKAKLNKVEEEFHTMMLLTPSIPVDHAPVGGEEANKVIKTVGEPTKFDFEPKTHIELGEALGLIDFDRGVKLMGTRGYVLKGALAQLELAVMTYALDFLRERGFMQVAPPSMAQRPFFEGSGHFPFAEDETFKVFDQKERDEARLFLIGTSEVPLAGLHADEILTESELPLKYMAFTKCFRTEVGSYGKDTAGLYRVKEFSKVEQVIVMDDNEEKATAMLQEILKNAEDFLASLEMPYQILQIATGDMGAGKVEMFDIETWMPSREKYSETHSASNLGQWQARRMNIRYKNGEGKKIICMTLNNTLAASPRLLIPLMENHQQADGSIVIPKVLQPYMGGMTEIKS